MKRKGPLGGRARLGRQARIENGSHGIPSKNCKNKRIGRIALGVSLILFAFLRRLLSYLEFLWG